MSDKKNVQDQVNAHRKNVSDHVVCLKCGCPGHEPHASWCSADGVTKAQEGTELRGLQEANKDYAYTQAMKNMGLDTRFGWVRFVELDNLEVLNCVYYLGEKCLAEHEKPEMDGPIMELWKAIQTELESRNAEK